MTVVSARHAWVGCHARRVLHPMGVLVCLGHVGWDPKLLDVVIIARQVLRHGHAVLGVQGIRHSHGVTSSRGHVSQSKSAPHWRRTRISVVMLIRVDGE